MKILILNYEWPPLGGGGGPVAEGLARGYVEAGHEVRVISMRYRGQPKIEERHGFEIRRVRCLRRRMETCQTHEMISYVVSALIPAIAMCRSWRPEVIHCHFAVPTGLLAMLVHWATRVPYVVTIHGSDLPGYNPDRFTLMHNITPPLLRLILGNASRVVSPSAFLSSHASRYVGERHCEFIPNSIDCSSFSPGSSERTESVLMCGRLLRRKGFLEVLEALESAPPGLHVHIAGDGPERKELEAASAKLRCRVIFHGWLESGSEEIQRLYANCSIFCLPSERENASVALLEAMASGMAIITSNTTGCAETIGDAGIVVSPRNVAEIRNALEGLLGNPARVAELGQAARSRAEKVYDQRVCVARYLDVLRACAETRKHGSGTRRR
ncbi:MAG: glycosyltransferase family 4 protein [Candidatus Hydrogenedentota bacterium]